MISCNVDKKEEYRMNKDLLLTNIKTDKNCMEIYFEIILTHLSASFVSVSFIILLIIQFDLRWKKTLNIIKNFNILKTL
jgi:hypothetical protein